MHKVKVVVFDLTYGAMEWLDKYGNEDSMELCEYITMDDDSPVQITELPQYDNWDYLLVFENGLRENVEELMTRLNIPCEKIIYPLDLDGSVAENYKIAMYIFKDKVYRYAKFRSFREDGEKYAIAASSDFFFMNTARDDAILPTTYISGDYIWSQDDMKLFYDLSLQYFKFTDKQDLFCDIGANIGTTCIYFKKNIDKNVSILAFEPSCENFKMLRINAILNDISIIDNTFVPMGLSDEKTVSILNYDPSNPGGSSIVSSDTDRSESIEITTFDEYVEENSIDVNRIKYFWVDVEGYEARFLKGARNTLSVINVPFFMEFVPKFYMDKNGEFELLMNEIQRHFKSFVCAQNIDAGKMPIDRLWEEQNNGSLSWDLFLLK